MCLAYLASGATTLAYIDNMLLILVYELCRMNENFKLSNGGVKHEILRASGFGCEECSMSRKHHGNTSNHPLNSGGHAYDRKDLPGKLGNGRTLITHEVRLKFLRREHTTSAIREAFSSYT